MYEETETRILKEKLIAVYNTKLLAPDGESFGEMIDYRSLGSNSISGILSKTNKDFFTHSVFHELESIVRTKTDGVIILSEWIEAYRFTSDYYTSHFSVWKGRDERDKCYALLDYILYKDEEYVDDRNEKWDEAWKDAEDTEGVDLRILLLMGLHVLPYYSGRGKVETDPVGAVQQFVLDDKYIKTFGVRNALVDCDTDLYDRMKAVLILYNVVEKVRMSFGAGLLRDVYDKVQTIPGVCLYDADEPVLWQDDKRPMVFWFFIEALGPYFLYECNTQEHTYTKHTIYLGSEFGKRYGRIIHPKYVPTIISGDDDAMSYCCMFEWDAPLVRNSVDVIKINYKRRWTDSGEWTMPFHEMTLKRMQNTNGVYKSLTENMEKGDMMSVLKGYRNAFPGTEYNFFLTLHAVNYDNSIVVDDVIMEDDEIIRNEKVQYLVDSEWVGDTMLNFNDRIGLLIMGIDLPESEWKKYIAIEHYELYLPVDDEEVVRKV